MSPTISVVLPVYNGERTLAESIRSVLAQSYPDFELIVINDGSRDSSASIISGFDDPRIRAYAQANQGLAATLNRGIELARGALLARIDQDDLAMPERFARQIVFLDAHPTVVLLGTWADIHTGPTSTGRYHRHPTSTNSIRLELLLDNPFVHSSVMMRTEAVRALGGYHVERATRFPEDYELWSRIARLYEVANLPEVLTIYRETPGSISRAGAAEILTNVVKISAENISAAVGGRVTGEECAAFAGLYHGVGAIPIGLPRLLAIWGLAAEGVAGSRVDWTPECRAIYLRVQRQLLSRFVRQRLPPGVLRAVRTVFRPLRH